MARTADEQMVWDAGEEWGVPTCADCGIPMVDAHCDYCMDCGPSWGCPCPTCETWQRAQEASYRAA